MVSKRLEELKERSGELIDVIEQALRTKLDAEHIHAEVKGRQKHALFHLEEDGAQGRRLRAAVGHLRLPRHRRYDIEDCYRALGVAHTSWPVVPGRFKDYISTPKQNDYQSLHTTVVGPRHQRVELQIRTNDMDDVAEQGVAAHAVYKDGRPGADPSESNAFQWLRRTIDMLNEGDSPEEFLEHTKLELFHDQVFCFTPKGRLIALPRGATPIDFAYAVHTNIGNSTVGCRINGAVAPIVSELNNGDEVEIIRAENHVPPPAWESLVITGKARAAIRRATREAVRKQFAGLGQKIVERAFARSAGPIALDKLKAALPRLARQSVDDVMAAVGRGEMSRAMWSRRSIPISRKSRPRAPRPTAAARAGSNCATPTT
jgi:guanosine-3',5'-bis(diphosphate) 3'-pyrophosphohydrolase